MVGFEPIRKPSLNSVKVRNPEPASRLDIIEEDPSESIFLDHPGANDATYTK
jgi:hypothetical protein